MASPDTAAAVSTAGSAKAFYARGWLRVTNDPREEAFQQIAARWARSHWISEADFLGTIRATRIRPVHYARLRARGQSRQIVARFDEAPPRSRAVEPLRTEDFDPWQIDRETLDLETRQVVFCPSCSGAKKQTCTACRGSGQIQCPACRGSGRSYSFRSKKMVNCSSCRGQGERSCYSCRKGSVTCTGCEGKGRLLRWFDVEEKPFEALLESDRNPLGDAVAAVSFSSQTRQLPVAPRTSYQGPMANLPEEARDFLTRERAWYRLESPRDRIGEVEFQSFCAELATIEYSWNGHLSTLDIRAWDQQVVENASSALPLELRIWQIRAWALVASLAGLLIAGVYAVRHSYLASSAHFFGLLFLALLSGLSLLWPLSRRGLRREERFAPGLLWLPAILVAFAQVTTAATGLPSRERALYLESLGRSEPALREAKACVELKVDPGHCEAIFDRIQLDVTLQLTIPEEAWRAVGRPFYTVEARQAAADHAAALTLAAVRSAQSEGREEEGERLLAMVPPEHIKNEPQLRQLLIDQAYAKLASCPTTKPECVNSVDAAARRWGLDDEDLRVAKRQRAVAVRAEIEELLVGIRSRRKSVKERQALCGQVRAPLGFLVRLAAHPQVDQQLWDAVEAACQKLEEEGRRKQDPIDVRVPSRDLAPLLCRDGSLSPSCVCGQASRRGCCSHHGGVAGCSQ